MDEYIRKDAVMWITTELGAWETQNRVRDLPAEEVQPAPQWISVEERMPEIGRNVLIYYPWWYGDEIQVAKLIDDGKMFEICGEISIMTGKQSVTHWMPLPEPPKE